MMSETKQSQKRFNDATFCDTMGHYIIDIKQYKNQTL